MKLKFMSKKVISLFLLTVLLFTLFAGCGGGTSSSSSKTPAAQSGEKTTSADGASGEILPVSAMVFDRGNTPEGQGIVTDNRWTQYLQEEMLKQGVELSFVPVPRSEEGTKIPVMMASGTAADVMLIYNPSMVNKFYNDGGTYDLAPYMDGVPDLVEYIGEDCLRVGRDENGVQWGIPARRSTTAQTNAFIRKDWLDTLGLEIPETVEDLYNALVQFKEKDPGNVGASNIVCFTGNNILQNSFIEYVGENSVEYMTNKGNEIYNDPGSAEYWRFKNKLYNEGLMDPEFFTSQNFGQKEKELTVAGQLGYWEFDVNGNVDTFRGGLLQNLKQNIPEAEFVSMVPVANVNDGVHYNGSYPINGALLFVPKTAKHPEAVMKYLNFLAGDGGFTVFHGIEGEHFKYEDGIPVVIDSEHNAETKDWTRHDLFLVGNQGYYKTEQDFIAATAKEIPGWENYVVENYSNAMAGTRLPRVDFSSPTQVEQSANINKVNEDYETKVTTCAPEEVDAVIAEWKSELEKYEIEKILAERKAHFEIVMG